jgi:hypothetical protein
MKLIDFRNQKFGEIPKQDNPSYDIHECLLLCKAQDDQTGLYVICKIEENQKDINEVCQLGLFWDVEMALLFANNITSTIKIKPIIGEKTWSNILNHEYPLWGR